MRTRLLLLTVFLAGWGAAGLAPAVRAADAEAIRRALDKPINFEVEERPSPKVTPLTVMR